jgi:hypothetical protein
MKRTVVSAAVLLVSTAVTACSTGTPDVAEVTNAVVTTEAETTLYAGICGFSLAGYDPNLAVRFLVEKTVDGTSLTLGLKPLAGWDAVMGGPVAPATVGEATTCGPASSTTCEIAKGAFSARYATLDVPGAANTISGDPIRLENVRLDGVLAKGPRFCSGLAAMMTAPLQYELLREENTCIFVKVADGDPLPALTPDDFHCP